MSIEGIVCPTLSLSSLIFSSVSLIESWFFQLSFWQNRSLTLLNLYSDQVGEPSEKCGDINFSIEYEYSSQTLKLKIIQVGFPSPLTAKPKKKYQRDLIWWGHVFILRTLWNERNPFDILVGRYRSSVMQEGSRIFSKHSENINIKSYVWLFLIIPSSRLFPWRPPQSSRCFLLMKSF